MNQIPPVVLGKQSKESYFLTALKSCEKNKKIPKDYVDYNQIKFLLKVPFCSEGGRVRNFDLEARHIKKALQEAQRAVIVDANSLENALALINEYKGPWNIDDDVVEKLIMVVYDEENPNKAEIVLDIKEALKLLEKFDRERNTLFITANGHAFNFAMDLAAKKDRLGTELPDFDKIVEIKPEESFLFIRSVVLEGKKVFVHETLQNKNSAIGLMPTSLTSGQKDRLNFVRARKR